MKPNLLAPLKSIPPIRRTFAVVSIVLSLVLGLTALGVPVDTAWTYQGQLRRSGAAYTGTCNFQFNLWDAASAGTQQGAQSINSVNVVNGLFTVVLDFGTSPIGDVHFTGDARWLATSVQCSGDGGFTPLDPRQPITAAPYALSLRPGATVIDSSPAYALHLVESGQFPGSALYAENDGPGNAVYAYSANGIGVRGVSGSGTGIFGRTSGTGTAIYGENPGKGFAGRFEGAVAITGPLSVTAGQTAVYGNSGSVNGIGVYGQALFENSAGVFGVNRDSAAIWGKSFGVGSAIYGENLSSGYAGRFAGPVLVEGNLIVAGTLFKNAGAFRIDHPLDPEHKFLSHSFVESPDMKNIYDGNVITDATGSAIVTLPGYFEALNRDYRYQLTVLGQFAQAIVSREIAGNSFEIHTDKPGVKVSWQVTGIRQDAYAQANPIVVEEFKPAAEQGMYLFPAGFGAGEEKRIGQSSRPETPQTEQKVTK